MPAGAAGPPCPEKNFEYYIAYLFTFPPYRLLSAVISRHLYVSPFSSDMIPLALHNECHMHFVMHLVLAHLASGLFLVPPLLLLDVKLYTQVHHVAVNLFNGILKKNYTDQFDQLKK